MNNYNYCWEIVKLTESNCSESHALQLEAPTIALRKNLIYLTLWQQTVF